MDYTLNFTSKDKERSISFEKKNDRVYVYFDTKDFIHIEFILKNFDSRFLNIEECLDKINTGDVGDGDPLFLFNGFLSTGFECDTIEGIINLFAYEPTLENNIYSDELIIEVLIQDDRFEGWYCNDSIDIQGVVLKIEVNTLGWYISGFYTTPIHNIHFFIKEENVVDELIKSLTLEKLIYKHAKHFAKASGTLNKYVYNDIPYFIPLFLTERIISSNCLEKFDFLNTGKLIELPDEEQKEYEKYVAKRISFNDSIDAEVFVKKDGTCMIVYP